MFSNWRFETDMEGVDMWRFLAILTKYHRLFFKKKMAGRRVRLLRGMLSAHGCKRSACQGGMILNHFWRRERNGGSALAKMVAAGRAATVPRKTLNSQMRHRANVNGQCESRAIVLSSYSSCMPNTNSKRNKLKYNTL